MKSLNKILQDIFRTSVVCLMATFLPIGMNGVKVIQAPELGSCVNEPIISEKVKDDNEALESPELKSCGNKFIISKEIKNDNKALEVPELCSYSNESIISEEVEKDENEAEEEDSQEMIVYITKTGKCYHKNTCVCLRDSKMSITLGNALKHDYEECSKCFE